MEFIIKHKFTILGICFGALAGYAYYHFIGCSGGSCSITSNPLHSTLYGASIGGLILNTVTDVKSKKE